MEGFCFLQLFFTTFRFLFWFSKGGFGLLLYGGFAAKRYLFSITFFWLSYNASTRL